MVRRLSRECDTRPGFWQRRRRELLLVLVAVLLGLALGRLFQTAQKQELQLARPMMGTLVEIRAEAAAGMLLEELRDHIHAAFDEMERVETYCKLGAEAATAAERMELADLLATGEAISRYSGGALDLGMRDLMELWAWEGDARLPAQSALDSLFAQRPLMDAQSRARESRWRSLGAIAKGRSVDFALRVLAECGVTRALVNAGGDVGSLGEGWTVGIRHPRDPDALLSRFRLPAGKAIATSGDYERHVLVDGISYHHLLDPATGMPARGCQSVSVLAPTCAEADAWATTCFVLGPLKGMALAHGRADIEILLVDKDGNVTRSSGFPVDCAKN